jgi:multiple sugar transport system permease protein
MTSTALKPSREISLRRRPLARARHSRQRHPTVRRDALLTYFRNSLIVSFATVDCLLVSVPAATAHALSLCCAEKIGLILFTYMFAPIMIIIPFYAAMRFLG